MPAVKKLMISTIALLLLLSGLAPGMTGIALAPIYDRYADAVLGQPDFIAYEANNGSAFPSAQSLNKPGGIAIHLLSGRLYVADTFNHRVLSWPNAASFSNFAAADMVFGQGGVFNTNTANNGGVSASSLYHPTGLAVDSNGNLYAADTENHRILRFNNPPVDGTTADMVFGQGGVFNTNTTNKGGASADSLNWPGGLAVDSNGNLYVADKENNRVLKYNAPLTDTTADLVLGQANFTTASAAPTSERSLTLPEAVAVDSAGNLYAADAGNFRVLGYEIPLSTHKAATFLFGQANFGDHVDYCELTPAADNLCNPLGIFVDGAGVLYISDVQFDRVLLFYSPLSSTPPVVADEVIGQPNFTSELTPKPPYSYGLDYPNALAVDSVPNLYVSDSSNNRVLRFDTTHPGEFTYLPLLNK